MTTARYTLTFKVDGADLDNRTSSDGLADNVDFEMGRIAAVLQAVFESENIEASKDFEQHPDSADIRISIWRQN